MVITPKNFRMIRRQKHCQLEIVDQWSTRIPPPHRKASKGQWVDCNWTSFKITRQPVWKRHSWKSLSFCLQPQRTCTWNLKLKFQSKLELHGRNHVAYRVQKPNKANLKDLIAATGLVISNWIQIVNFSARVTVKFDGWPRKTIGHFFYTTSSFVHHFKSIGEFKLGLQSRNAQFGSKLVICYPVRPWNLMDDVEKQ